MLGERSSCQRANEYRQVCMPAEAAESQRAMKWVREDPWVFKHSWAKAFNTRVTQGDGAADQEKAVHFRGEIDVCRSSSENK